MTDPTFDAVKSTNKEVNMIVKASGLDRIPVELLRYGGNS